MHLQRYILVGSGSGSVGTVCSWVSYDMASGNVIARTAFSTDNVYKSICIHLLSIILSGFRPTWSDHRLGLVVYQALSPFLTCNIYRHLRKSSYTELVGFYYS